MKKNIFNSPSGKYKIIVSSFGDRSSGEVYYNENLLATVNRNLEDFPFLFIEDHPSGHDYLICGEDYQGQTVIELDSGIRKDYLPEEAAQGFAFCCISFIKFDYKSNLLLVDGCHWACPYEFRFIDFYDPMSNLIFLETDEIIPLTDMEPSFESDGTIKTFQRKKENLSNNQETSDYCVSFFKRNNNELKLI